MDLISAKGMCIFLVQVLCFDFGFVILRYNFWQHICFLGQNFFSPTVHISFLNLNGFSLIDFRSFHCLYMEVLVKYDGTMVVVVVVCGPVWSSLAVSGVI